MPLYEYRCTQCGECFEVRQSIGGDGTNLNCPKCKAGKPIKLISTFSSPSTGSSFSIGSSCGTPSTGT
jgi:putative FmdB family regulatory protein